MKTMLEYQKMILEKVSFDKNIFKKELVKSLMWLQEEEFKKLIAWVWGKFGFTHRDVINSTVRLALLSNNQEQQHKNNNFNYNKGE